MAPMDRCAGSTPAGAFTSNMTYGGFAVIPKTAFKISMAHRAGNPQSHYCYTYLCNPGAVSTILIIRNR